MSSNLQVTLIQSPLKWQDIDANLNEFSKKIACIQKGSTDLIILPEMFTTGFSMNPANLAEPMNGKTVHWMKEMAKAKDAVICGSAMIEEANTFYNRFLWVEPNGSIQSYDKRHCFSLANEQEFFQAGKERLILNYKGWKICPLVCYDLRFPVWSRNNVGYDLLLYVANWPSRRSQAWKSLLVARAIENQVYTIGVNRVGKDENGLDYSGDSSLIDYAGKVRYQISEVEDVFTTTLFKEPQQKFREKLPFLDDQDDFEVKI